MIKAFFKRVLLLLVVVSLIIGMIGSPLAGKAQANGYWTWHDGYYTTQSYWVNGQYECGSYTYVPGYWTGYWTWVDLGGYWDYYLAYDPPFGYYPVWYYVDNGYWNYVSYYVPGYSYCNWYYWSPGYWAYYYVWVPGWWQWIQDDTPPLVSLSVPSTSSSTSFAVSWSAQDDNALSSAQVQYWDNGSGPYTLSTATSGSTTFTGVNGHTYNFQLTATDQAGNTASTSGSTQVVLPVSSLGLTLNSPSIAKGSSTGYAVVANYSDGTSKDVTSAATVTSSSTNIATVSGTSIIGVGSGSATITASYGGQSASSVLTVVGLQSLSISPSSAQLQPGQSIAFSVIAGYSDGSSKDVTAASTFTSTSSGITMSGNVATAGATASGAATITASYGGQQSSATVQVVPSLQSLSLSPTNPQLQSGQSATFSATAHYSDGTTKDVTSVASFSSSAPTVVSISGSVVTASSTNTGSATITVSYGGQQASTTVQVVAPAATLQSLSLSPTNPQLQSGQSVNFSATAHYSDGTTKDVTSASSFSSSAPTVVATSGSTATASSTNTGSATITASYNGLQTSTTVQVVASAVTLQSLTLSPANPQVQNGQTVTFAVTATYSDSSTKDVTALATLISSASNLVSINGSTATAASSGTGSATITANYGGQQASTVVQVVSNTPHIAITSPSNGDTLRGVVTLSATLQNPPANLTKVVFYLNNQYIQTATGPNWSVTWDTSSIPPGSYTLAADGMDSNNNPLVYSQGISVNVGTQAQLQGVSGGQTITASIPLSLTTNFNIGSAAFYWIPTGGSAVMLNTSGTSISSDKHTASFVWVVPLGQSNGQLEGIAYDTGGSPIYTAQVPANLNVQEGSLSGSELRAMEAISLFETSNTDGYWVLSDPDGKGFSWGVIQWNFGSGTLQPLLKELDAYLDQADPNLGPVLRNLLNNGTNMTDWGNQTWASSQQTQWIKFFSTLGGFAAVQAVQRQHFRDDYFVQNLNAIRPLNFHSERAVVELADIAVQNGGMTGSQTSEFLGVNWLGAEQTRLGRSLAEQEQLLLLAEYAALRKTTNTTWAFDVWYRKSAIASNQSAHGVCICTAHLSDQTLDGYALPNVGSPPPYWINPGVEVYEHDSYGNVTKDDGPASSRGVGLTWAGGYYVISQSLQQ